MAQAALPQVSYLRCSCPIWVDGRLNDRRLHQSLGTADWLVAQQIVRKLETDRNCIREQTRNGSITVEQAWLRFIADLEARKLHPATIRKYRLLQRKMKEFASCRRIQFLGLLNIEDLSEFRNSWKDGALSACKKLERLRAFFGFAVRRNWITESPVRDLRSPKVSLKPTMPFTQEEMARILAAVDTYRHEAPKADLQYLENLPASWPFGRWSSSRDTFGRLASACPC
jgi:hypothetical protein